MARAPWSPTGIAIVTVVLTPLVGAVLHAVNYSRLGLPQRWRLALFSNLITATLVAWTAVRDVASPGLRWIVALLLAAYFYRTQEARYTTHRSAGGLRASLVLPVILLLGAVIVLGFLLSLPELLG